MGNTYKIVVGEVPLAALGPVDEFLFRGHEFTHSFVALVDENNNVVEELHGNSYNVKKQLTTDNSFNPRQMFNMVASKLSLIFRGKSHDKLRVFLKTHDRENKPDHSRTTFTEVLSGTKEDMLDKWNLAVQNAVYINSLNVNYVAIGMGVKKFGQKCHSVTVSLLRAMGVEREHLSIFKQHKFLRPGWRRNLKFDGFLAFTEKTLKGMRIDQIKSLMISSTQLSKNTPAQLKRKKHQKNRNAQKTTPSFAPAI